MCAHVSVCVRAANGGISNQCFHTRSCVEEHRRGRSGGMKPEAAVCFIPAAC